MKTAFITLSILSIMISSCQDKNPEKEKTATPEKGTLAYDLQFLKQHDSSLVQLKNGTASVLVSARYQGKVFTSGSGDSSLSFGWINYKAFAAPQDPHMNAYGGENRLWLGPEGGQYSLFFAPGDSMVFDYWKTPAAIDTEAWETVQKDEQAVSLRKNMQLTNYRGTHLNLRIDRVVSILTKEQVGQILDVEPGNEIQYVGYSTSNKLTNTGTEAWTEKSGMPCIWILDMFNPSPSTTIVIPYKSGNTRDRVATTDYFGEIPKDRITIGEKAVFFRADGKSRGKLGILPAHVLPIAGSYDADHQVLTITRFTVDPGSRYLNQEWNITKPVFSGDAMNAYNDGPLEDGKQMGPFYEIESVSPAAALAPGASLVHDHDVFHFSGNAEQLNNISQKLLGVSLDEINKVFR